MPVESIIVPVYNAEKAVSRCIDSILKQDFTDFELILIDDGSKDSSPQILDEYAAKDSRVRVIHKKNGGVSAARNTALDAARGEYIRFLDADDWMTQESDKLLVRNAQNNSSDLVVADFYRVVGGNLARKGNILTNRVLTRQEYAEYMMESPSDYYYGVLWNKLYRRDIIEKHHLRMDEHMKWCEDFIFNLDYVLHADRITALQVPVYYYVKTEGSLVAQNLTLQKIIQMKTSVFTYYDQFYRDVFDEEKYNRERLQIQGFLINAASDDMVLPLSSETKKIGEEITPVYFTGRKDSLLQTAYYLRKIHERLLQSLALKYDIELRDAGILFYMYCSGRKCTLRALQDITGYQSLTILNCLRKLMQKGLVDISFLNGETWYMIGENCDALCRDMDDLMSDIEQICFDGMDGSEVAQAGVLMENLCSRLLNYLKKSS
ncbi:MAG: glycosyltransferase [Solobacterium sp.]|nr:glycosyltransferase [Solobacterium sp.]